MADDTQKTLEEIEKVTADLSRNFSKIKKEITDSGKETNVWLDATKELQTAQSNVKNSTQTILDLGKQYVSNLKERNRLQNEELPALDKAKTLLDTRKAQNDALIASTQALLASSSAGSIEAINAQQKLNKLTSIGSSIDEDIIKNRERYYGIVFDVIPALDAAAAKLRDQAKAAASIRREEKERKEIAEKMVTINEHLMQPLIGDAQEFSKAMKFADAMGKNINNTYIQFYLVVGASLQRFKELDKAAGDFREKTGFIVTQTRQLDKAAREVNVQFAALGISIGSVYATIQALTDQFQVVGLVTKEMISDTAQMAANIGIAITDAAKFRGLFTSISKSAGMTATQSMQAATALAEMGGVAPSAVIKDMAEASGETLSFLAKSPMALIKATVEARRLGTTVNSLSKSARGFLNYQDSITSELEASALIGKSLNFQEARAAAYAGDVVKSRELALKQLEKAGDFTKLNVYQQEALAKAAGMTVDEVIKQQNQQKMLAEFRAKATGKDKEMLDKYEAMQRKIAENEKAAKEDLVARGREMMQQQLRQAEMNKLTNALNAIWTDITDALLPIANNIMPAILVAARALGMVFKVIGAVVRGFLSAFDGIGKSMRSSEEGGLTLEAIMSSIGNVLNEWVVPIVEKMAETVGYAIKAFAFLGVMIGKGAAAAKPFVSIGNFFIGISSKILTFADSLGKGFSLLKPFLGSAAGIFKFIGSFAKSLGLIGLVITAIQVLWKWISSVIDIFKRDDLDLFEKLAASLAALGTAIWDVLVQPIIDAVAWILNKIWPGLGDGMLDGIKKIGSILYKYTIQPFVDAYHAIKNIFTGDEGIGTRILNAISSIGEILLDVLTSPFKIMWEFVSSMFSGGIIDSILGGLKSAGEAMLSVITWPFRKMWEFVSGLFGGEGGGIIDSIISGLKSVNEAILNVLTWPFRKMWEFVSGLFGGEGSGIIDSIISGLKSVNEAILNVITWPFRKMWEFVTGLFSGGGGESIIGSILGGLKSAASGIIDVLTWPFRKMWEFVTGLFSGGGGESIIGSILSGLKSAASGIIDVLTWPFRKMWEFVTGLFSGGGGESIIGSILGGLKSAASGIIDVLTWPFRKMWEFVTGLFSGEGSGIIGSIIDGIKNAVGKIFDILTWPFRKVVDLVSGLFGGDGQLGSKIIGGIKTVGEFIFDTFTKIFSTLVDVITWPFRKAFDLVKKIPFISKLFGGNSSDATATVSGEAKVKADGSSTSPMEVKGLTELKDSIVKLTEAITKLNGGAGGTATAGGGTGGGMYCEAVVSKLDELIKLMSEGNIGVNIDGVKASKLLARAST